MIRVLAFVLVCVGSGCQRHKEYPPTQILDHHRSLEASDQAADLVAVGRLGYEWRTRFNGGAKMEERVVFQCEIALRGRSCAGRAIAVNIHHPPQVRYSFGGVYYLIFLRRPGDGGELEVLDLIEVQTEKEDLLKTVSGVKYREAVARLVLLPLVTSGHYGTRLSHVYYFAGPRVTCDLLSARFEKERPRPQANTCGSLYSHCYRIDCAEMLLLDPNATPMDKKSARELVYLWQRKAKAFEGASREQFHRFHSGADEVNPIEYREMLELMVANHAPVIRRLACQELKFVFGVEIPACNTNGAPDK